MRLSAVASLAHQSLLATPASVTVSAVPSICHVCWRQSLRRQDARRPMSTWAGEVEPNKISQYKRKRLAELRQLAESEHLPHTEAYPRLRPDQRKRSVADFLAAFHEIAPSEEVTLYGRVRSKRVVGKNLLFLDIVNEFQKVQIMVNKNKLPSGKQQTVAQFSLFRNMVQVGDHISVTGNATRTQAGETTLDARHLPELLSPALEQIPEKLTDPKTRMLERHVDMLVNKEVVDVLRLRAEITRHMRNHFHSKRFLEFQTPILAENAGGAVARPFTTRATEFRDRELALRIAPELWLKRLVVGGVDKVFEIGPSFRNEGVDATHNPEFTMCEFYSAYSNLADLINETEELLHGLARHCQELISTQLDSLPAIDMSRFVRPFKQVEFIPALEEAMGLRFPKLSSEDALPEVLAVLKLAGIHVPGETPESLAKLLDKLAAMFLEPLSAGEPLFITNHPAVMSPLAKSFLCPRTYQMVSARAELFVRGRELANMYEEENDPEEQRRKMMSHRRLVNMSDGSVGVAAEPEHSLARDDVLDPSGEAEPHGMEQDGESSPLDESYVRALDHALPPTGGWGCGVERLVMLFSGSNRISDCLSFGTIRNVVGLSADEQKTSKAVGEQEKS